MIDLSWNIQGRVSRQDYRKARWIHFAWCLIPVAIFIATGLISQGKSLPVLGLGFTVGFILLMYYRYRFIQLMIRRLHDTNHSGKLLLLGPVAWLALIFMAGVAGYMFATADSAAALPAWLDPDHSPWLIFVALAPFLAFSIYLRYQLSREGTSGSNRYGPAPGARAAAVF